MAKIRKKLKDDEQIIDPNNEEALTQKSIRLHPKTIDFLNETVAEMQAQGRFEITFSGLVRHAIHTTYKIG